MCAMNPRLLRPLASGAAFTPATLSGLFGWYDASDAATVTVETGVKDWASKGGTAPTASQTTTNNQPAYGSVTLNGKSTITFDGVNDFLRTAAFTLPQPYSIFSVWRYEVAYASAVRVLEMGQTTNPPGRSGEIIRTAADNLQLLAGIGVTFDEYPAGSLEAFAVHDAEVNGASSIMRINGVDTGAAQDAGSNAASILTIAANRLTPATGNSNITFAELVIYDRILSAAEASDLRDYLTSKWGL